MVAPVLPALDHGRGLAVAHQLGRPDQRRVLLAPHALGRVLVHGDDLGAGDELEAQRCRPPGRAGPTSTTAIPLVGGPAGPGHDLGRGPVAAHGVDRHRQARPGAAGHGRPAGSTQSTSTAWRPLYHPQFGQTTWGTLACVALRAHAAGRQLEHPVGGPAAAALGLGCLLLGDGHRRFSSSGDRAGGVSSPWPGRAPGRRRSRSRRVCSAAAAGTRVPATGPTGARRG